MSCLSQRSRDMGQRIVIWNFILTDSYRYGVNDCSYKHMGLHGISNVSKAGISPCYSLRVHGI